MSTKHIPVLVQEILSFLRPASGVYVDMTLGGGSLSRAILEAAAPDARLIGIDCDDAALRRARQTLAAFGDRVTYVREDFRHLDSILADLGIAGINGVVIDPGPSMDQYADLERGFSFEGTGLDMRYDRRRGKTAADIIAELSKDDLAAAIRGFGEEGRAGRIAAEIVKARQRRPISDAATLAAIVRAAVAAARPGDTRRRIRPETQTFMAIRSYLNDELNALSCGVRTAAAALVPPGRICVLTYHSLEDRTAKRALRDLERACSCPPRLPQCRCGGRRQVVILTKRPVRPSAEEVQRNPSARSAKLRVAERC
ncbi:MAG: 16S rRNA (cytosine(1402)-N(4))-methyltransferase RsmH [Armatimonadota bacterium]